MYIYTLKGIRENIQTCSSLLENSKWKHVQAVLIKPYIPEWISHIITTIYDKKPMETHSFATRHETISRRLINKAESHKYSL